jgi:hypothetical protein
MPASERCRNQVRATSTSGTTATSSRSSPVKVWGSTVKVCRLSGVVILGSTSLEPSQPGR